jgi:hypothetical protein
LRTGRSQPSFGVVFCTHVMREVYRLNVDRTEKRGRLYE